MNSIFRIFNLLFLLVLVSISSLFLLRDQAKRSLPEEGESTARTKESSPNSFAYPTEEWIQEHFPNLPDNFCSKNNPGQPSYPQVRLSDEQFRMYHIGKAAGGTVNTRIKAGYGIHYNQCHPNPTECFDENKNITTSRQYRFITIRDPIDRYVASFEWMLATRCEDGQTERCKKSFKPWVQEVYDKYDEDPSRLGEALCDPQNGYKLNQSVIDNDLVNLHHLKAENFIHIWLGEHRKEQFDWTKRPKYVYPIVVEKPFDLIRQVDDALYHLAHETLGKMPAEIEGEVANATLISYMGDMEQLPLRHYHAICRAGGSSAHKHSAEDRKREKPVMSEHAVLCLARYYQRDYQLLPDLQKLTCKSVECHAALQSIIDRRSPLLEKLPPI
jgi:hypothetical protein